MCIGRRAVRGGEGVEKGEGGGGEEGGGEAKR